MQFSCVITLFSCAVYAVHLLSCAVLLLCNLARLKNDGRGLELVGKLVGELAMYLIGQLIGQY